MMRIYRMEVLRPNRPRPRAIAQSHRIVADDDARAVVLALQHYDAIAKTFARDAGDGAFRGLLRAAALSFQLRDGHRVVFDSLRDGPG
jgi:hypothetical protein